jgi:putative GTP pyrophosphokinase
MLSKSQVDKIGDRLRRGEVDADALTRLSEYQIEFDVAYKFVERILAKKMYLVITGRPAKSTISIIEKLRRINSRLSQVQDISGCRVIVHALTDQDDVVRRAREWFPVIEVDDKREMPTHGYRAVHLLVTHQGKCVEVQVRTRLQHFWATISEKVSDTFGQEIKYGVGNDDVLTVLNELSEAIKRFEVVVDKVNSLKRDAALAKRERNMKAFKVVGKALKPQETHMRHRMYELRSILARLDELEDRHVLSD